MIRTLSVACLLFLAGAGSVIAAEPAAADITAVPDAIGPDAPPVPPSAIVVAGTNAPGDAARINAAIAASTEGAEIVIRGTCLIDEPIRLRGNRSYRGESRTGTVLEQAGHTIGDVDLVVPHQANLRIIKAVGKSLDAAKEQMAGMLGSVPEDLEILAARLDFKKG